MQLDSKLMNGRDHARLLLADTRTKSDPPQAVVNGQLMQAPELWYGAISASGWSQKQRDEGMSIVDALTGQRQKKSQVDLTELARGRQQRLIDVLVEALSPGYTLVQPVLDYLARFPKWGYNDHSLGGHIRDTMIQVDGLLRRASPTDQHLRNWGTIISLYHDYGYLFGVDEHAFYSAAVMWQGKATDEATEAVALHESSSTYQFLTELLTQINATLSALSPSERSEKLIEGYGEKVSILEAALQGGDKSDMNPFRMNSTQRLEPQALEDDMHFWLNMLCPGSYFVFGRKSRITSTNNDKNPVVKVAFRMPFSIYHLGPELPSNLQALAKKKEGQKYPQWYIPSDLKKAYKESLSGNKPNTIFEQWSTTLWENYKKRFLVLVMNLFRLYPQLEEVTVSMYEREKNEGIKGVRQVWGRQSKQVTFKRESLADQLAGLVFEKVPF